MTKTSLNSSLKSTTYEASNNDAIQSKKTPKEQLKCSKRKYITSLTLTIIIALALLIPGLVVGSILMAASGFALLAVPLVLAAIYGVKYIHNKCASTRKSLSTTKKVEITPHIEIPFIDETLACLDNDLVINDLQAVSHAIIHGEPDKHIEYMETSDVKQIPQENVCFKLKRFPNFIFKTLIKTNPTTFAQKKPVMSEDDEKTVSQKRLETLQKVKAHLEKNDYPNLYFSDFKVYKVENKQEDLIITAHERLDLLDIADRALSWRTHDVELRPAFQDLGRLIQHLGLKDITPKNFVPFCRNGKWSLVLLDLEQDPHSNWQYGLKELMNNMHSQESMQGIIDQVPDIIKPSLTTCMNNRLKTLEIFKKHENLHINNNTSSYGEDPLHLTASQMQALGLNLDEEAVINANSTITMKEAIKNLIQGINTLVSKKRTQDKLTAIRIAFCRSEDVFVPLKKGLEHVYTKEKQIEKKQAENSWLIPRVLTEMLHFIAPAKDNLQDVQEEQKIKIKSLWIEKILDALVEKQHILSWKKNVSKNISINTFDSIDIFI